MQINKRLKNVAGSLTLAITAKAKELKAKGHDVVNFAGGEPDFNTPDFINNAAIEAIRSGFTKYTPSVGIADLREIISKKFLQDNHLKYSPNQIVVSCGAKHSLFNLIQVLVDEGNEVLIPSPFWVSYPEMVKIAGGTPKFIQTTLDAQFKITAEQLKKSVTKKTKCLVLNSPSNPTGMLYTKDELKAIADVCVQKQLFVISDEIYEKLVYNNEAYPSLGSLNEDIYHLTATVNGVSKAYAMTGWRIGYFGASQEIADYAKKLQDHSTSNPTSISQKAAVAALQASQESINTMRDEFKKRRDVMVSCLKEIPEIKFAVPQGAFYIFCDFSKIGSDANELAKRILEETNVAIIPGDGFGAKGYMRLSFATSVERIREGTKRIQDWVKKNS
ncbi:MAG: pyridoxal phosphate-dependent aminotransferase [Candidatus Omnitrophota bacterium]